MNKQPRLVSNWLAFGVTVSLGFLVGEARSNAAGNSGESRPPAGVPGLADDFPTDQALTERELAWHILSRAGYGPRPGQVERVLAQGIDRYLDSQLAPASSTQPKLAERLEGLRIPQMSADELADLYPLDSENREEQKEAKREDRLDERRGNGGDLRRQMDDLDGGQRIVAELGSNRLIRAVYSDRQLEEVMVDFWFNHFNVFARKGRPMPYLLPEYEAALRKHAFGHFEDLLVATAKSPAMLYYLDNWLSVDENASRRFNTRGRRGRGLFESAEMREQSKRTKSFLKKAKGLNENYARELLELHTLGVDGGYSQKDVEQVARCFTGWSLRRPGNDSTFAFRRELHDDGAKLVLGNRIDRGGMADGMAVLHLLAQHPATARHISLQLAQRFVSDHPPESLVRALSARFSETRGDIREVLRTLFNSPEFRSREAMRAKVKTPLEFVVSALRATDADVNVSSTLVLLKALNEMSQPLYLCQPPNGYADVADTWVNAGAMLGRMNFATRLAERLQRRLDWDFAPEPIELSRQILGFEPSPAVRGTLEQVATDTKASDEKSVDELWEQAFRESRTGGSLVRSASLDGEGSALALILGSPDFQRQ